MSQTIPISPTSPLIFANHLHSECNTYLYFNTKHYTKCENIIAVFSASAVNETAEIQFIWMSENGDIAHAKSCMNGQGRYYFILSVSN